MQPETIEKVRAAIKDRAIFLALLFRSYSKVLPAQEAEEHAREAIFEFGRLKAQKDPLPFSAEKWVERHVAKGSSEVFASQILIDKEASVQQMTVCPLVEAWRELGCDQQEIELLCDIAMEGDRGRAAYHNVSMEITHRLAAGDAFCRLVLKDL
jgi:hypothetical protein